MIRMERFIDFTKVEVIIHEKCYFDMEKGISIKKFRPELKTTDEDVCSLGPNFGELWISEISFNSESDANAVARHKLTEFMDAQKKHKDSFDVNAAATPQKCA